MERTRDTQPKRIFTDEQMDNFAGFYSALKRVHTRLIQEGYTIENGKITTPKNLANQK